MADRYVCLICHNEIPHAGAECPHCRSRRAATIGATPQLLIILGGVMIVLFTITGLVSSSFHHQMHQRAQMHQEQAQTLADYGYYDRAIDQYREALTFDREAIEPRLGLAQALYRLDRFDEAETHLIDIRAQSPTLSVVNLLLARLAARKGKNREAVTYYRAAVYGQWPRNPTENRLQARFELIGLLEKDGEQLQAVAELIELRDEAPRNPDVQRRIGRLFLESGAPDNAAEVFEQLATEIPADGAIYFRRAQAEFQLGNFLTTRTNLRRALQHFDPDDPLRPEAESLLNICSEVIDLDPTHRPISAAEKRRRSKRLVDLVVRHIDECLGRAPADFVGPPERIPAALSEPLDLAREMIRRPTSSANSDEYVEESTLLAEQIWADRALACDFPVNEPNPIALVLDKLAR